MLENKNLSSLTAGTFSRLLRLFIPILGITFCNGLFPALEKIFFAKISIEALNEGVNSLYASLIFQAPCLAVALMCQVFVGRWQGAKEWHKIGPGVWQFIWFSLFSIFLIVPLGLIYGIFYFQGKVFEATVWPYYIFILSIAFLYPLGATLSSFYLGLGKTRLVVLVNLCAQLIRVVLCYCFVFGVEGWIPAWGIMGAPLSSAMTQVGICLILFIVFIQSKYAKLYRTREYFLRFKLFREYIYSGLFRGIHRILTFASWASIAHLMALREADFLLVLSIGGTMFLLLSFFSEAIFEAQITVASQILGKGRYLLLNNAFLSGSLLVGIIAVLTAVPLFLFPSAIFSFLFPGVQLNEGIIQPTFLGVWISFLLFTYGFVPVSHILAFKDTKFFLYMGMFNWINGYLLMYFFIEKIGIAADKFWLALSLMHGSNTFIYVWRMRWLQSKVHRREPLSGTVSSPSPSTV